jgi:intracellular septation protein
LTDMSKPKPNAGWSLAIDYGPLIVFFIVYKFYGSGSGPFAQIEAIMASTGAFMVATVIALIVSRVRLGKVSPMLWLSSILIIGFGGLTIWMHDPSFIQRKPTAVYLLLGATLLIGIVFKKPLLKVVLEAGYDGLSDRGWMVLSRNWGLFFFSMALLNEVLVHFFNQANGKFETWLWLKVWAFIPLSITFAAAHVPFLMRHGLGDDSGEKS